LSRQFIQIEEEAKEFIKNKRGVVTVSAAGTGKLCCGKINFAPEVRLGQPLDPENYHQGTVDGIVIYQHKDLNPPPDLSIGLASAFGIKYLVIYGWKLV